MRFTGLTRVRNAGDLIGDTLDHLALFCSEVFVFDDASEDDTVEVARCHPLVRQVLSAKEWSPDQQHLESVQRHILFEEAKRHAQNRWFLYLDVDERLEFDRDLVRAMPDAVAGMAFRLFDFYMTPDDREPYRRGQPLTDLRQWCGPEYRDILMAFDRERAIFPPHEQCVREPSVQGPVALVGHARHYGKALSVAEWDAKCAFYMRCFPRYAKKWARRRGQAIHTRSDFGAELIEWPDRARVAVPVPV